MICSKLNRFVFALKRLRRTVNESAALTAYHGYVASILRYGLLLWGNSTNIVKAFLVQKKCVRAVSGVGPLDSCRPLFKKLKILTLTGLYIMQIGVFVREHPDLFEKADKFKRFQFSSRDPTRLMRVCCRTTLYQRNCSLMAIKVYNNIPMTIRELPFTYFKIKLFNWLSENCFYNLIEFFEYKVCK